MNYHNKKFKAIDLSPNAEVDENMTFHYQQWENIVTCTYQSKHIQQGQLIGLVDELGNIDMRYQQVNALGELHTGVCISKPEIMSNGKIRLHEKWQWTSGDQSTGHSILEEL